MNEALKQDNALVLEYLYNIYLHPVKGRIEVVLLATQMKSTNVLTWFKDRLSPDEWKAYVCKAILNTIRWNDLEMLQWFYDSSGLDIWKQDKKIPEWEDMNVCAVATQHEDLAILMWAREMKMPWGHETCMAAIHHGNLRVLLLVAGP